MLSRGIRGVQLEDEQTFLRVLQERGDPFMAALKELADQVGAGVAYGEPHDFGRWTFQEAELAEVVVLGDDREAMELGVVPDHPVTAAVQADEIDVLALGKKHLQPPEEAGAQVLVE
jgi:hypothetical protein